MHRVGKDHSWPRDEGSRELLHCPKGCPGRGLGYVIKPQRERQGSEFLNLPEWNTLLQKKKNSLGLV